MNSQKTIKGEKVAPKDEMRNELIQINTLIDSFEKRLKKVEEMREKQMEFIFQSVSITIGIFAVVLTLVFGLSTQWEFDQVGETLTVLLLLFISVLVLIWFYKWSKYKKRES